MHIPQRFCILQTLLILLALLALCSHDTRADVDDEKPDKATLLKEWIVEAEFTKDVPCKGIYIKGEGSDAQWIKCKKPFPKSNARYHCAELDHSKPPSDHAVSDLAVIEDVFHEYKVRWCIVELPGVDWLYCVCGDDKPVATSSPTAATTNAAVTLSPTETATVSGTNATKTKGDDDDKHPENGKSGKEGEDGGKDKTTPKPTAAVAAPPPSNSTTATTPPTDSATNSPTTLSPTDPLMTPSPTESVTKVTNVPAPAEKDSTKSPTQEATTKSPSTSPTTLSPTPEATTTAPTPGATTASPTEAAKTSSPTKGAKTPSPTDIDEDDDDDDNSGDDDDDDDENDDDDSLGNDDDDEDEEEEDDEDDEEEDEKSDGKKAKPPTSDTEMDGSGGLFSSKLALATVMLFAMSIMFVVYVYRKYFKDGTRRTIAGENTVYRPAGFAAAQGSNNAPSVAGLELSDEWGNGDDDDQFSNTNTRNDESRYYYGGSGRNTRDML